MKTCGQCIIYAPDMYGKDCSGCAVREYDGEIKPETPACGRYISRRDFLSRISRQGDGTYQFDAQPMEDNSGAAPVKRYWAKNRDAISGRLNGRVPYCPSCNTMTFGRDHCEYCGQPFVMDKESEEYFTPKPMETRACPVCGAVGTYYYFRHSDGKAENGHCSACGTFLMDYPYGMKGLPTENGEEG